MQQRLCEECAWPVRAAGALESVQVRAGRCARNRYEIDVLAPELFEQHEVTRVLHEHRISGSKQDASQEVERLGGAESRHDVGGPGAMPCCTRRAAICSRS